MTAARAAGVVVTVVVTVVAALAGAAAADEIALGPATIELDASWRGDPPVTGTSPVLVRTSGDAILTVSRVPAPNPGAWRSATRDAYLDEVEAGLVRGATKLASKRRKLGRDNVNVLDLTLRRTGPAGREVVAVRVLLFRTLTVAAAAAAPDTRANRKRVEAAVTGLAPTAR